MRKLFLVLPILLLLASRAEAINGTTCPGDGCVQVNVAGQGSLGVQITGTWVGTITFQGSVTNQNFENIYLTQTATTTPVGTTTANGLFTGAIAGLGTVRVIFSAYTSGTATVSFRLSASGGASGGGGSSGGGDATAANQALEITAINAPQYAEGTVFTTANLGFHPLAVRRDVPTIGSGVADGDRSTISVDAHGALETVLVASDGTFPTFAVDSTIDAGIQTTGPLVIGRASTATPSAVSADNDAQAFWVSRTGALHLASEVTEDVAETAGGVLIPAGAVQRNVAASSAGTTGDNATINVDILGLLWARFLDPCSGVAKTPVPFSISSAITTQLIAADASNKAYICSITITVGAADNVALVEDDTSACASPSAGMSGGVTAATGWNFAANGGLTVGTGLGTIAQTSVVNRYVCLMTSSSAQASGNILYVLAP